MTPAPFPRLLGDVGGTNARFAWQAAPGAPLSAVAGHRCADDPSLSASIRRYLREQGLAAPASAAIGIANPVTGDAVRMTNHHWSFSIATLEAELGLERLVVLNDFTALALSLPALETDELHGIGGGTADADAPRALIGPGTGLGVSGLFPDGRGGFVPIAGEGGHVTLAAADDEEAAVLDRLRAKFGHASAERALSGPGLVNLAEAVAELAGRRPEPLQPADVLDRARSGRDPDCGAALDLFCRLLGSVAGNLALTLGARGGVYIGGGIVPRLLPELARSKFRERFEDKGRFRAYLAPIPTCVIGAAAAAALRGAAAALDRS